MKEHDIISIRRADAHEPAFPDDDGPAETASTRRGTRRGPDRTTRLAAEVLGITIERAAQLLQLLGGLEGLAFASEPELVAASIPRTRAKLVPAAFELARQSIGARPQVGKRLAAAHDVWMHLRARLSGLPVEEFWALALDVRHRVVMEQMLARGSLTAVEVHPRDVFRALIKVGASAVIFCHTHPSGDPEPSRQDIDLTKRLREVGDLCGIALLDHVVVGASGYVSLCERGWA
jgi:DNA repair protein RadC